MRRTFLTKTERTYNNQPTPEAIYSNSIKFGKYIYKTLQNLASSNQKYINRRRKAFYITSSSTLSSLKLGI